MENLSVGQKTSDLSCIAPEGRLPRLDLMVKQQFTLVPIREVAQSAGTELKFGVNAEGKSLESIADPLSS